VDEPLSLAVSGLCKSFNGLEILKNVDIGVRRGECHAVIGPNGAGKTTLFNVVSGKFDATSGKVIFNGNDITNLSPHVITRKGLARSFQITNLFLGFSVYDNVRAAVLSQKGHRLSVFRKISGLKDVEKRVRAIVERVGLEEVGNHRADELSYGHQRKLEIAVALGSEPSLIMLDEPTAGLDKNETKETVRLIKEVTQGISVMIIEHDMDVVFSVANRVSVLCEGQIVATDDPDKVRDNPRVREAYLGTVHTASCE
jgi:branched-chain amino acid transport system ATP-binding protein